MRKLELERLNQLADELEELHKEVSIAKLNAPTNRREERERLIAAHARSQRYDPTFVYPSPPSRWDDLCHAFLSKIDPQASIWDDLIYQDTRRLLAEVRLLKTKDPLAITNHSVDRYGSHTQEMLSLAENFLASYAEEHRRQTISAQSAAEKMKSALEHVQLKDWTVVIEPTMAARISVMSHLKLIRVRSGEWFSEDAIDRLLVHEIGTHVFRAVNGEQQPLRLLRMGLNTIETEEGLAIYHEKMFHLLRSSDQRRYALRYIAAWKCLDGSFYDVFRYIAEYTTIDESFDIVARAKRGFTDTSQPGAHLKDKVYFEGYHLVTGHLELNPDDYSLLMSGKISISMLPDIKMLKQEGCLAEPRLLPGLFVDLM